jgi:hypothetical protein
MFIYERLAPPRKSICEHIILYIHFDFAMGNGKKCVRGSLLRNSFPYRDLAELLSYRSVLYGHVEANKIPTLNEAFHFSHFKYDKIQIINDVQRIEVFIAILRYYVSDAGSKAFSHLFRCEKNHQVNTRGGSYV